MSGNDGELVVSSVTPRPGVVRVFVSNPACQNLKQGCTRILPGVQAASSQLTTKSFTKVSWEIHSMLIGENSFLVLCFLLTTSSLEKKARYTFGPATKHLDSIDFSV